MIVDVQPGDRVECVRNSGAGSDQSHQTPTPIGSLRSGASNCSISASIPARTLIVPNPETPANPPLVVSLLFQNLAASDLTP
jgi:hypothetical protein